MGCENVGLRHGRARMSTQSFTKILENNQGVFSSRPWWFSENIVLDVSCYAVLLIISCYNEYQVFLSTAHPVPHRTLGPVGSSIHTYRDYWFVMSLELVNAQNSCDSPHIPLPYIGLISADPSTISSPRRANETCWFFRATINRSLVVNHTLF